MTASRKIDHLASDIKPLALNFLSECLIQKIDVLVICTYRSPDDQAALYAQGRTVPGKIVTWAKPGQSAHNLSIQGRPAARAFDAIPLFAGKIIWELNAQTLPVWQRMGAIAESIGLSWAGRWPAKRREFTHFYLK